MKVKRSGFILPILFHPGNPPTEALAKVGPDSDTLILPIRLILRIVFRHSYPAHPFNPENRVQTLLSCLSFESWEPAYRSFSKGRSRFRPSYPAYPVYPGYPDSDILIVFRRCNTSNSYSIISCYQPSPCLKRTR
jgi:hypothetical protein